MDEGYEVTFQGTKIIVCDEEPDDRQKFIRKFIGNYTGFDLVELPKTGEGRSAKSHNDYTPHFN